MSKRFLGLLIFVLAGTLLAHAGRIEISEPLCQPGDIQVTGVVNGFAVIPNTNGGGEFKYCNATDQDWTSIIIGIQTTAPVSSIQCPSSSPNDPQNTAGLAFSTCLLFQSQTIPDLVYAYFFGTSAPIPQFGFGGFLGVPDGHEFTVDLDCHDFGGCTPWPAGTTMVGTANWQPGDPLPTPVPEPASLTLLATGLASAYFRRKRRA